VDPAGGAVESAVVSPEVSMRPPRHRRRPYALAAALAAAALAAACSPAGSDRPRAVVFLIGDGLGPSQVTFSRDLLLGQGERFAFESLPVTGIVSTWSASNLVTDSGAAATAMAAGVKTTNQAVGVAPDGAPLRSIAERAQEAGWRVGYVTTTEITHATPAAFYASVPNRYLDVAEIASQLLEHRPDVALGGGLAHFLPTDDGGARRDGRDLVEEAKAAGYTVLTRGTPLPDPPPEQVLGLYAWGHLAYVLDDRELPPERRDPALAVLAKTALAVLERGGKPFFLMVEGGRIDHAAHSFDAHGTAVETMEFDRAVEVVLDFQKRRPETLVLLTADHATGGLAINDYTNWEAVRGQQASVDWLAEQVRNAGAGPDLVLAKTGVTVTDADLDPVRLDPDSYESKRHLARLLAAAYGVTWIPRVDPVDTKGHTGEDVVLYAGGPGAERFGGAYDNTDIAKRLAEVLGWGPLN
jgi:alkaline phosphatase